MPGSLPATAAYADATTYTVDEAQAAGALGVALDRPVISYTEDFIGLPVGSGVPVGTYDRAAARWVASPNGRVVELTGISGGRAQLDVDGDGQPDDGAALGVLGITGAERSTLARLYTPGAKLVRTRLTRLSGSGVALGPAPPSGARRPTAAGERPGDGTPGQAPCPPGGGSDVGCERQRLGETIPVAGTPFSLRYQSDRQPGYRPTRTIDIPVTGAEIPGPLERVEVSIDLAGRHLERTYAPEPNQRYHLVWDGRDAWGRRVPGAASARITVTNVYPVGYHPARAASERSFADAGANDTGRSVAGRGTAELRLARTVTRSLGVPDPRDTDALGGFTLDVHHAYDPAARTVFHGDGTVVGGDGSAGLSATRIAGRGHVNVPHDRYDGIDARDARVPLHNIASGPDGTVYLPDASTRRIYRITPDGRLRAFAGNGERGDPTGDGGPARRARLGRRLVDVAIGPDGSAYVLVAVGPAPSPNQQIRRIAPDGTITTVAGGATSADGADGIAAKDALVDASSLAVGPDGAIYLDDRGRGRLRRIGPDGRIGTLAGGGSAAVSTTPKPGRDVRLGIPAHPAVAPDGSVYLATERQNRVLRLAPDGSIAVVAGTGGTDAGPASGRATETDVPAPRHLGVAPDGTLYIASAETYDSGRAPVVAVSTTGRLTPFAGDGACTRTVVPESINPLAECIARVDAMTVLPDGSVVYAGLGTVLRRTGSPLPGFGGSTLEIPSADGRTVDVFDRGGRHLETRDALTNGRRYRFGYDTAGRLSSITDGSGRVTRIERAADGRPTAIVAPGGARTALAVGRDGDLATVTNPLGGAYQLAYAPGGLLKSLTQPGGGVLAMQYDDRGLLTRDTDADGVRLDLARTETDDAVSVGVTDGDGHTTTYRDERRPDGTDRRTVTEPAGGVRTVIRAPDGTTKQTDPDGTTIAQRLGPDPRFGLLAPVVESRTVTRPSGRTTALAETRTATFATPGDRRSRLVRLEDDVTVDGKTRRSAYAAGSRTASWRTAAGRLWRWTLDDLGRTTEIRPPGESPITRTFDGNGRLTRVAQGSSRIRLTYDAAGHVVSRAETGGPTRTQTWDAADRLRSVTEAGATVVYGHDADGRRTSVRLPRGGTYAEAVSPAGRDHGSTAPGDTAGLTREFTLGGRLDRETWPGGRVVDTSTDAAGRLAGRSGGGVQTSFGYADATDRLTTLIRSAPPTGAGGAPEPAATLAFAYDGDLPTSLTWGGPFAATAALAHDGAGRLTKLSETVAGTTTEFAVPHDDDGLAAGIGAFTFTRDGPRGRVSAARAGGLRAAFGFDAAGRPNARVYEANGKVVYREDLGYDRSSRVIHRRETTPEGALDLTLGYDGASRLAEVRRGAAVVERYGWDADGNRSRRRVGAEPAETTTYDTGDRIARAGDVQYTVDADGVVTRRGGDTFAYTADGELTRAVVGTRTITYRYDGVGRRISRTDPDGTTRYLYDDPRDVHRLTATIDPGGGSTRYLYDGEGLLLAIERGGERFLVGTDVNGTPHVVADATGRVRRRIATDSFGRVTADTAPAFPLAVGFGGGLADPDTGLVRLGVRDYDPETGRFTARDPARFDAGDPNLYAYAGGDPVARRDPTGLGGGAPAPGGLGGGASPLADTTGSNPCVEAGGGATIGADVGPDFEGGDGPGVGSGGDGPGFGASGGGTLIEPLDLEVSHRAELDGEPCGPR